MAKEKQIQNSTSSAETNTFIKGMIKDFNPSYAPKQNWSHARNMANYSIDGDIGTVGNEPANLSCANIPYTIIGAIHLYADQWVTYSTDDVNSEIGLFDDSKCEYKTIVNSPCLNFKKEYLIVGASKENFDCTWQVYWDDSNNPSRTLNINKVPYVQKQVSAPGDNCVVYEDTDVLDCEKLRLAPLVDTPIVKLSKASDGGQLRNGTYQAYIAYVVNEQRVTDYIGISNLQSLFDHDDTAGSLDIKISNLSKDFDYFELVILSNTTNNYVAKRIGLYSTETSSISIDYIDPALISIALEILPLRNPAYEKSDAMFVVNDWLIRKGPTEQFDFNYQPIANQIKASWVVAEYPNNYYYKGGNKVGFMRDEQYAFFIRWIYNTGERSNSYHIPGRASKVNGVNQFGLPVDETAISLSVNSLDSSEMNFQVFNTATITSQGLSQPTDDGGIIIAKGEMGYWQSTERYPADRPDIWNATYTDPQTGINIGGTGDTRYDLCGKFIRHHKMPSEETGGVLEISNDDVTKIRILGVEFSNIGRPKYNDGTYIENIVGYEILRSSREGAKSILAKGIFRNMREYTIPNEENAPQGLYPNYPYNDLSPDIYFHDGQKKKRTDGADDFTQSIRKYEPLKGFRKDVFTFHSPEMMFKRPFLNAYETKIYGTRHGKTLGTFINSEKHPQTKLLRNGGVIVAAIFGIGYALEKIRGRKKKVYNPRSPLSIDQFGVIPGAVIAPMFGANTGASVASGALAAIGQAALDVIINDILLDGAYAVGDMATGGLVSTIGYDASFLIKDGVQSAMPGSAGGGWRYEIDGSELKETPTIALVLTSFMNFAQQFAVGANEMIEMMYNLISADDMVLKYNSHGFYSQFTPSSRLAITRSKNKDSNYIGSVFQNFGDNNQFKINNLFRPKTIAVYTEKNLNVPVKTDDSRITVGSLNDDSLFRDTSILSTERNCSALYGALKFQFENQYGQLDQIKQVPMRGAIELIDFNLPAQTKYKTSPIFSGDTYVGRYSEKVIMPIFTNFLYGQPEDYAFDYLMRTNIPYPRYWMDTKKFDVTQLVQDITSLNLSNLQNALPNDLYYLDRPSSSVGLGMFSIKSGRLPLFSMKNTYMYTHVNGINEFYVESEINVAHRDWGNQIRQRHYDPYEYTNLNELFDAEHIREDNYYKYDFSLSASRFITNLITYGRIQPRDYDPKVAEKCYTYYPKRLIYSLQAKEESKKDFWRVFLPNNYKDFKNPVNVIKPVNKNGAIIFFPYQSPQMFQGVDQLQTDLGTKITIGDGGLFNQPFQNLVNSDISNEYGSCESARSVVNTPMGIFFISQAQGAVFHYTGQLENISNSGMKWWFNKYLPSQLIQQFPVLENTPLADNPVVGVGCQTIYDATDDIVYFCKKDYRLKDEFIGSVIYDDDFIFKDPNYPNQKGIKINLTNSYFFENVSWTVSYDPKSKAWISFHDWHPELVLPSINHFLTTKTKTSITPYCPPGYSYNSATNTCEKLITESAPAPVIVTETSATISNGQCNCPTGYTLVYPTGNTYTGVTGICDAEDPPICRKVTCDCPPPPFPNAVTNESGVCDDIYNAGPNGNPNYTNFNPKQCGYFYSDVKAPSYELGGMWRHNYRCDLYANYYGTDYPWEIEIVENTGQLVNTVRSLEYQLECYVYKGDLHHGCGDDRWHDLDYNFDELIVYNSEQISGLLTINEQPKNDPIQRLNYPQVNFNNIDIVASKIEQKYRINQFWDITIDRGEFTNVQQQLFETQENGYIKNINQLNIDYNKAELQRKKFRHYYNKFLLSRRISADRKMLLKLNNTKLNLSFR